MRSLHPEQGNRLGRRDDPGQPAAHDPAALLLLGAQCQGTPSWGETDKVTEQLALTDSVSRDTTFARSSLPDALTFTSFAVVRPQCAVGGGPRHGFNAAAEALGHCSGRAVLHLARARAGISAPVSLGAHLRAAHDRRACGTSASDLRSGVCRAWPWTCSSRATRRQCSSSASSSGSGG